MLDVAALTPLLPWLLPLPAVLALAMSLANAVWWPRRATPLLKAPVGVSICIPARNEAVGIEASVLAALSTCADEVVILDDGSSDDTPAILARLAALHPRLKLLRLDASLPEGWVGKPRACMVLADRARGSHLVFVDADVVVVPDVLQRLDALRRAFGADVVTAVPRQVTVGFLERLVLPLLHVTYTAWLFLPLIWRTRDPRFLAANGQLVWLERDALDAVGGFAAVKGEIVDDMALCRAMKRVGRRVLFADGHELGTCRMYRSPRAVIDGFSKNLYEGVGGSVVGLVGVIALYGTAFVAPWLVAGTQVAQGLVTTGTLSAAMSSPWTLPALTAMAAGLALRLLHVVKHRTDVVSALLHPLGVVVLLGIAVRSWWWSRRGRIAWAGRQYSARRTRVTH